ncbi:MAG: radical SAM family heme chaperone HemW [Phycisphaeraceae bacterium]|nr:radical SAM family heme chaperone HemW [Phycisphaeraceae bacterium]MCW5762982.1 radical SAM family heme chaperone HemW [Phycisphaeraceae bacterium]
MLPGRVRSLYLHVPFCSHKCHYCDFYSLVDRQDRQVQFVERLVREIRAISPWGGNLETIFVGGGTPTLLAPELWQIFLKELHEHFVLSSQCEFTVECNPETASAELMAVLKAGGVNRLSLGVQSFNPVHLKTLERVHRLESVPRAIGLAREAAIDRISIDLIYAIPGQTLADWSHDLDTAIRLGTDHVSCYNLTYEPRTAMTARLERGEFEPTPEETEIEMFELTGQRLRESGFERYEVSNYARPDQACRHNLAYWRQDDWLAAGPSASAHVGGHRWKNTPHLETYLSDDCNGFASITDHEPPDAARALRERIMTGLRLAEGLDADRLLRDCASDCPQFCQALEQEIGRVRDEGLIQREDSIITITERGIILADGIAARLMSALL